MAGVGALSKDAQAGLKQSLAAQSAPPNPQTPPNPQDRKDPDDAVLIDMQRVRKSLDVAKEHLDDADPKQVLIAAMHACFTRLLTHVDLSDAVDVLLERLFPLSSATLKERLKTMFAPVSPPPGLGGGAQQSGFPLAGAANQGPAGGATGQPPGGAPQGSPMPGDAGMAVPA
jgi:hypothetical protein